MPDVFYPCVPRIACQGYDGSFLYSPGYDEINLTWEGIPSTATAVAVRLSAKFNELGVPPGGAVVYLRTYGVAGAAVIVRAQQVGYYIDCAGIVPLALGSQNLPAMERMSNAEANIVIEIYGYFAPAS